MKTSNVIMILMIGFISASCSKALKSNSPTSRATVQRADAEASYEIAADEGCKQYFSSGSDVSFDVFDLSGSKHPLCSILTEAAADYTFIVPFENGCDNCVETAKALVSKVEAAGASSKVKVALLALDEKMSENVKVDLGDLLVFSDKDKKIFPKLESLGYAKSTPSFYALGRDKGSLFKFEDATDIAGITKALGVKVEASDSIVSVMTEAFNLLVNWDGTSNLFDDDVVVEQQ